MSKVTKIEASEEAMEAVVTLDDGSQHIITVTDFDGFAEEITADAESGELADYLSGVPEMFRDSQEEIDASFASGDDFAVIYSAE